MRIRSTKPEFWKSKRIASVSWEDRLLLKGLESYVDDNGVGVDDVELIVTDVFPRDMFANPRETVARVSEGITRLTEAGLLHRYTSESDSLLYVAFWEEIQRIDKPGKGRYPRPDGTWNYKDSAIREGVANPRETVAPGTGEQGNRGTGEQGKKAPRKRSAAKPPSELEQRVNATTTAAYEAIGKACKYEALRGIAKWCIQERDISVHDFEQAVTAVHKLGKPITKQTIGQQLDGHFSRRNPQPLSFDEQRQQHNNEVTLKAIQGGADPWNNTTPRWQLKQ